MEKSIYLLPLQVLRERNYATSGLTDFEPSRSAAKRAGLKACKPNSAKAQAKSGWPLWGGPLPANFVVAPHSHCLSSAQASRLELGSGLGLQLVRNFFLATLALALGGCVMVHQVDRETLSQKEMQFEPLGNRQSFLNDVHSIREGASGGVGQSAGGGCGCN